MAGEVGMGRRRWLHVPHAKGLSCQGLSCHGLGAAQVAGEGFQLQFDGICGQRDVPHARIAIAPLPGAEGALDGSADGADQGVASGLPARQFGVVLVGPEPDAIRDAGRFQGAPSGVRRGGHVGIDGALIAHDEAVAGVVSLMLAGVRHARRMSPEPTSTATWALEPNTVLPPVRAKRASGSTLLRPGDRVAGGGGWRGG